MKKLSFLLTSILFFIIQNSMEAQVQKWYSQDFSNDTGGWSEPAKSPNSPVIIEGSNPYLQNQSTGTGNAGSRWLMINTSAAWTGDYDEADVEFISMDVRNSGDETVHLRFAFSNDEGIHYVNTQAVRVSPGTQWQTIHFSLDDDDLMVNSGGNIDDIMKSVNTVRLISNPDPAWQGETIKAAIDIDNILMTGEKDYAAYLTGENQMPSVFTQAYGVLFFEEENDSLTVWGGFEGITSGVDTTVGGGMHIHAGLAGQNGGVLFPISVDFNEDRTSGQVLPLKNQFALTEEQEEILENHGMYVNVHSTDFKSGEIRGQILEADEELYRANLHGSNELPSILSPAEGRVVMELDSNELTLSGSFHNLSSALATNINGGGHIHLGLPGSNGAIQIPLSIELDSTQRSGFLRRDSNQFELTTEQLDALRNRNLYVNIHSIDHPGGEIRGQIVSAASRQLFRAYLSGTNEVPMVVTSALGIINVELLTPDSTLIFGSYSNLISPLRKASAGGIHIHGGMAGENKSVLLPLENTQDTETKGRLVTRGYGMDSSMYALLMNRSLYINVHSEAHGGGEIRGQILSDAPWHFTAPMTSSQELSPAISNGYGMIKGEWNGRQLILSGVIRNLSAPIATSIGGGGHIHMEMPGKNGGVIFPLDLAISENGLNTRIQADSNVYILADSIVTAMMQRGLYANIHTENYRSGEVRGQLLFDAAMYSAAVLSGSMENPPVNTPGKGLVLLEVNPQSIKMVGTVSSLTTPIDASIAGGAHLHNALAGRNGPVVMPITIVPSPNGKTGRIPVTENSYTIPAPGIDVFNLRGGYLNVHTIDHPSGEVRGQILPLSSYYLIANLSGDNEVPSIESSGIGTVILEVNNSKAILSGTFNNLTSPLATHVGGGAHIHVGPAGKKGNVLLPLHSQLSTDSLSGVFPADSNFLDAGDNNILDLLWNGLYVNVHSKNHAGGEVRGQLLPMINYFPDADSVVFTSADLIILDTTNMNTRVVFEWTPAIDVDPLAYQLEWAVDSSFDSILYRSPYTLDAKIAIGDSTLLDTLRSMGYFMTSDSVCLLVRIHATDGSLMDHSQVQEVCFVYGVRTNREDPLQSVVQISPVPASQEITITIQNYEAFRNQPNIRVSIYSISGRFMKQQNFRIHHSMQRETIDIQSLPAGQYFLQLNNAIWPFIKL